MFAQVRVRQAVASFALTAMLATAALQAPPAHAEIQKTDLVVLYQGYTQEVTGGVMRYTVANPTSVTAKEVTVTKTLKISGSPNTFAAPPEVQKLGSLGPLEVREIKIWCSTTLGAKCQGSSITAKTSTPEIITTNNSAGVTF
jgi:hypothetical protein